jgi:hypothetical protein
MHATLIAATLLLGAGADETSAAGNVPGAPAEFYAVAPRPYAPSVSIYYPSPDYDCYSHGHRGIECYPAFCERNYRRPYNYRVKFDYPWHEDVYRNWPDGCGYEQSMPHYAVEAHQMYSGSRRSATRARQNAPNRAATAKATTLRDAPLPPPRTLR